MICYRSSREYQLSKLPSESFLHQLLNFQCMYYYYLVWQTILRMTLGCILIGMTRLREQATFYAERLCHLLERIFPHLSQIATFLVGVRSLTFIRFAALNSLQSSKAELLSNIWAFNWQNCRLLLNPPCAYFVLFGRLATLNIQKALHEK